jgi:glycosyltransferase involved in cell wall biosynthesis
MVHLSHFHLDSRIQRQATALAERGDVVDVVGLGQRDELRVGDGVIRVHAVGVRKPAGGVRAYLEGYARFSARAAVKLSTLELRHHFDVVEAHNMPDGLVLTAILPKLRGTGIILNLHDTFPELMVSKFGLPPDSWQIRALEHEERVSAAAADLLLTATVQARARLAERSVGVGRTHVIMNAPDERAFGPPRAAVAPPAVGEVRVLYHGGTAPRFGVETLVTAVAQLVDGNDRVTLRICGIGDALPQLRQLAARIAPARAEVVGPVPFAEIPAELRAAHIGVVPTLHDCFTELLLPVKLLEYVHTGLPVVASDLPGIRSYFSPEEVRMVRPGDPVALAAAIAEMCADPASAAARAARASVQLTTMTWRRERATYLDLIDDLAGRPSSSGRPQVGNGSNHAKGADASGPAVARAAAGEAETAAHSGCSRLLESAGVVTEKAG